MAFMDILQRRAAPPPERECMKPEFPEVQAVRNCIAKVTEARELTPWW